MFSPDEYQAIRERAGLLDRQARGRLLVTGEDRRSYLHGLLTNDIAALGPGRGCYAALLTPQGRMVSDMRVSELGTRVLIDLPAMSADAVRQRLADFIFSEDVEVADAQHGLGHLAVYGPQAAPVLASVLDSPEHGVSGGGWLESLDVMPVDTNTTATFQGTDVIVIRSEDYGVAGYEIVPAAERTAALDAALRAAGAQHATPATLDVSRVEAGRPEFGIDMDQHTIPLEAGIEDRAISLTKGCYVGQEVIIRVLHRGHGRVARRLVGFVASGDTAPAPGRKLYTPDGAKEIGAVTSGVLSPRLRRPIGLGYVHRDHAEPGTVVMLGPTPGEAAQATTVVTLPFPAPSAAE